MACLYVPFVLHRFPLKPNAPSAPGPGGNGFYFRVCGARTSSYILTRVKGFRANLTFSEDQAFFMQWAFEQEDTGVDTAVKTYTCVWTPKRTRRPLTWWCLSLIMGRGGAARCYRNHDDRPQSPPVAAGLGAALSLPSCLCCKGQQRSVTTRAPTAPAALLPAPPPLWLSHSGGAASCFLFQSPSGSICCSLFSFR